jgi:thymidylate synthase ThyX
MLINAQAIINMARKRLCMKAHPETRLVYEHLKDHMKIVDPDLARYMVPECEYRGGVCHELRPCGKMAL